MKIKILSLVAWILLAVSIISFILIVWEVASSVSSCCSNATPEDTISDLLAVFLVSFPAGTILTAVQAFRTRSTARVS